MQAHPESETTEVEAAQRRRAAAAFVLITASLAVGILVGRLSVSVVPGESSRVEASAKPSGPISQPSKPLTTATEAPAAPAHSPSQQVDQSTQPVPRPAQPPKLALTKDLAGAENVAPPNMQVISAAIGDAASPSAQGSDASAASAGDGKVSVINPGASQAPRDSGKAKAATDQPGSAPERVATDSQRFESRYSPSGAEECERRYSSFRREDGTYQPYGGGPRMRCPHLR
jgi:hypothetical protein